MKTPARTIAAQATAPQPVPDDVTVCVTSCARVDLLSQTMQSFRAFNPGGRTIISEDSADPAVVGVIEAAYPDARVLSGPERIGQMRSIDRMFGVVETTYLFHLEDDWVFEGPVAWDALRELLATRPDVSNVCVREFSEIKPKYRVRSDPAQCGGASFQVMRLDAHPEFFGWSNGPGLMRTALYHSYAPFGRARHDQISAMVKRDGGREAYLLPGVAHHIGQGRNVRDPTAPPRAKSKLGKWVRWAKKRLYYAGLRKEPF
jgi:hypothetical protein